MIVAGNGSIGEGNSALSIDAAAREGAVVSGDRHILDGYPSLRINAAPVAITCIPRGGRLVVGDRGVGDRNYAGVVVDIDAAAVAVGGCVAGDGAAVHGEAALLTHIYAAATAVGCACGVVGNCAAVHGEARRVGVIRRADKEHTAAGAAAFFITGNRSTIHGKGRAGLIGAAIYTDLHAAGDRAAVQLKFAAIDEHFALNPAAVGAVSQRQRSAVADRDTVGNRLPVQAEGDLAFWHSPAPRHRLRQVVVTSRSRQGIGRCPFCPPCASSVMFVPVDVPIPAADAVGMYIAAFIRVGMISAASGAVLRIGSEINAVGLPAADVCGRSAVHKLYRLAGVCSGGECRLRNRGNHQRGGEQHSGKPSPVFSYVLHQIASI